MPLPILLCFEEGRKNLDLCWGSCEAIIVGCLVEEERARGLGEEHSERGFEGEQRARGLGEADTELCFGEVDGKHLGELGTELGLDFP